MGLKDWVKNQNKAYQEEQERLRREAELDAVKPHLLRGGDEAALMLYCRTSLILRGAVTPVFPDERKSALVVRKWFHSLGIDGGTQQNLQQEVSYYDDESQQQILGEFAAGADRDAVIFLFCDFAGLHSEKYSFEGEVLEFFRGLAGGIFHLPPNEIAPLELLCRKIASGGGRRTCDKFGTIPETVLEYYLGKPKQDGGTYLVVDLSGGAKAGKYPLRYTETAPDLSSDACRTSELWLKHITRGVFTMGSPTSEQDRYDDEKQHQVKLTQDFYIGVFPVTQRQWELVMGDNPSHFKDSGPSAPVEQVSYDDICGENRPWPVNASVAPKSFLGRIRSKTGLQSLDLPTEAQWEYACRAGTTTAFSFGNSCNGTQCNCDGTHPRGTITKGPFLRCTCKVGKYSPNPWGIYDMHGNVWEWCADRYGDYFGNATDPKGGVTGSFRVDRGGSWCGNACYCRSADRNNNSPGDRLFNLGFRLVALPSTISEMYLQGGKLPAESLGALRHARKCLGVVCRQVWRLLRQCDGSQG